MQPFVGALTTQVRSYPTRLYDCQEGGQEGVVSISINPSSNLKLNPQDPATNCYGLGSGGLIHGVLIRIPPGLDDWNASVPGRSSLLAVVQEALGMLTRSPHVQQGRTPWPGCQHAYMGQHKCAFGM